MKRALWMLLAAGCASAPPLALNTDAWLPPQPVTLQAISDNFSLANVPVSALNQSPWKMQRILCFGDEVFALVLEDSFIKLLRYDGGWKKAHEGLLLPADGFQDASTLGNVNKDGEPQVDLLEDVVPINNRLVLIYRKTTLSNDGDRHRSIACLWDPRTHQWKEMFNTAGRLAPINPDGASEAPDAQLGDLYLRLHNDAETVSLFKYNIFSGEKTGIGTFACSSDSVDRVYLGDQTAFFVNKKDDEVIRYRLKTTEEPQAWKIVDHTSLLTEDTETRILAVSGNEVYFLYNQNNHPNLGCFSLDSNQVESLDDLNQKLVLAADQPMRLMYAYCDKKIYLASTKGLFYLNTQDPNRILFSFGRFPEMGDALRLLFCGIDQASGSMAIATMRPDQSLTLFRSRL